VVQELPIQEATLDGLARAMVGRHIVTARPTDQTTTTGDVVLEADHLSVIDSLGVARLKDVSLSLRAGEIVGVAGVSGNGQSELMDVLCGLLKPDQGRMNLLGSDFSDHHWLDPSAARAMGLAHVPEDRHARALVMAFGAWESAVLGYDDLPEYATHGWMHHMPMRQATSEMMQRFDVRPRDTELLSSKFSGGNQQKLVLARELGRAPKVLLVGQPTRGVDIGAIEFIYTQLRALRHSGCAVLLVSSELDEILALSDRVLVMNQGRISGELPIAACTESALGGLMTGASA
jgi:simple sugar transport system ATP-binding protein